MMAFKDMIYVHEIHFYCKVALTYMVHFGKNRSKGPVLIWPKMLQVKSGSLYKIAT